MSEPTTLEVQEEMALRRSRILERSKGKTRKQLLDEANNR